MKRYKLINIGRRMFCGEVETDSEAVLLREVKKHLASKDVDLLWNEEQTRALVEAGFHVVGRVEAIK